MPVCAATVENQWSPGLKMEQGPSRGAGERVVGSVGKPSTEEAEIGVPHSSESRRCLVEVGPQCVPGESSEGAHMGAGLGSRSLPFTRFRGRTGTGDLSGTGSGHTNPCFQKLAESSYWFLH